MIPVRLRKPGQVVRRTTSVALVALLATTAAGPAAGACAQAGWSSFGYSIQNTRFNPNETKINAENASRLKTKWTYQTHGDVSATPAVVGGAVYFPDWGGWLHKVEAATGRPIWSKRISDYTGDPASVSRTSPTVVGDRLYLGDWTKAMLMVVDTRDGSLIWKREIDTQIRAVLTGPPTVHDGVIYQGVSSRESELGMDPDYQCCVFRGSANAIDANTGEILWRRFTVPDNGGQPGGYSGGAIWSMPALDPATHTVYFTTGQNYNVPQEVSDCQSAGNPPSVCQAPDNYIDSMLALDTATGAVKWHTGAQRFDAWNTGCIPGFPPNNCPINPGPDYDLGDGGHIFTIRNADGSYRKVIGAGAKSGEYWLLDAATGQILWSAAAGPGGKIGGIMWGTAWDGKRIYLAEANFDRKTYTLADGTSTNRSSFAALDPVTGQVLWQKAEPTDGRTWGPLSVANGVLYGSSTSGQMYAMDAANGKLLWQFTAPYSTNAGPAVVDGTVYWGNGYARFSAGAGTTGSSTEGTFYAFSVDGR